MSRPFFNEDLPVADELADIGITQSFLPSYSPPEKGELARATTRLEGREKEILTYREKHSLHLTELQAKILNAIGDDKIYEASLRDLVNAYKVLKDKELVTDGKPNEIKGLVGFLIEIENEDKEQKSGTEEEIVVNAQDIDSHSDGSQLEEEEESQALKNTPAIKGSEQSPR